MNPNIAADIKAQLLAMESGKKMMQNAINQLNQNNSDALKFDQTSMPVRQRLNATKRSDAA